MFSTLRTRFGIPGVISVVALVFAMFGGAYAASSSSGGGKAAASAKAKKGPRGPKGATGPAGPAGPQGPAGSAGAKGDAGAAGSNGTNGTNGTNGKTVLHGVGAPGSGLGTEGDFYIDTNLSEIYGPKTGVNWGSGTSLKGEEGSPWTATGTLPEGSTETGIWGTYINHPEETLAFPISFPIPLETEPEAIFLNEGEASKPGCPGLVGGIPTADPGKLCVYTNAFEEATLEGFSKPSGIAQSAGAGRTGTFLNFKCTSPPGFCQAAGTWAVTAAE